MSEQPARSAPTPAEIRAANAAAERDRKDAEKARQAAALVTRDRLAREEIANRPVPKTRVRVGGQDRDAATVTFPNDRKFRAAWILTGAVVEIDMVAARTIHRDKIRTERMGHFDPFDKVATPLSRKAALGNALTSAEHAQLQAAEAAAQKLRDAPQDPRIDAATTPAELEALTLDILTA